MPKGLAALLALEIAVFSITGQNFLSWANGGELIRVSVEVGLLSLALTCVIITGGIDLSVGSTMGLSAVLFGALWQDAGLSPGLSALLTLAAGLAAGGLNALCIARLGRLPLIITLGTFSLFRGMAEGITGGVRNFTGFPASFLFLGQGFWFGAIPAQAWILAVAVAAYWVLLHRTTIGRALFAVGSSPEGARYAGLPVRSRLALVYILSGFTASVAAIVYVAHLGQAKSDAGTGYELMAITAVVLGGTSIFGGRGSIPGTMLGLGAIVVLQNGLRLSGLPVELTGILTGCLLIGTIVLERMRTNAPAAVAKQAGAAQKEEDEVKNSQVAVLSAVVLAAAGMVCASNWWMVRSLAKPAAPATAARISLGMMPKSKGDPYFVSCRQGAEEAAREFGVELLWDGPADVDPARQNEVVESWITRGVSVIAVSVDNEAGISTVLRKARERGIRVLTWDADAQPSARDFFINQATAQGIGYAVTDQVSAMLGGSGEFAIITDSLTAANQNEWIKHIKARIAEKHKGLKLVTIRPSDGDRDRAFAETQTILKVHPHVKVIAAIAAPAVPGAAEAVKQSGRTDVKVTGLSLPNLCKPYVHAGIVQSVILWNTKDLGYLTVLSAQAVASGKLKAGDTELAAGRLGKIQIAGDQVLLGLPFLFTKENIDRFDF